ncbi:MAG: TfoX/Sxy family protein [Clostridia bacterium]|nr:TfoX/Sxy family protein [Clostridia bacterium]
MSTTKDYLTYIIDQLSELDHIKHRQMMGEYIIYYKDKIAAYLCDNRVMVKPVPSALNMIPNARFEPPYEGAKDMIVIENADDREFLTKLFNAMYDELPQPKKRGK